MTFSFALLRRARRAPHYIASSLAGQAQPCLCERSARPCWLARPHNTRVTTTAARRTSERAAHENVVLVGPTRGDSPSAPSRSDSCSWTTSTAPATRAAPATARARTPDTTTRRTKVHEHYPSGASPLSPDPTATRRPPPSRGAIYVRPPHSASLARDVASSSCHERGP